MGRVPRPRRSPGSDEGGRERCATPPWRAGLGTLQGGPGGAGGARHGHLDHSRRSRRCVGQHPARAVDQGEAPAVGEPAVGDPAAGAPAVGDGYSRGGRGRRGGRGGVRRRRLPWWSSHPSGWSRSRSRSGAKGSTRRWLRLPRPAPPPPGPVRSTTVIRTPSGHWRAHGGRVATHGQPLDPGGGGTLRRRSGEDGRVRPAAATTGGGRGVRHPATVITRAENSLVCKMPQLPHYEDHPRPAPPWPRRCAGADGPGRPKHARPAAAADAPDRWAPRAPRRSSGVGGRSGVMRGAGSCGTRGPPACGWHPAAPAEANQTGARCAAPPRCVRPPVAAPRR